MKTFNNPSDFANFIKQKAAKQKEYAEKGLKKAAILVEKTAKSEFGNYQPGVDVFPAWKELADATKQDRIEKGFTPNDPLLRTGGLRDSISHKVDGFKAAVGSESEIMADHEFGTSRIPPRPVLGPALFRNKEKIKKILGAAIAEGIASGKVWGDNEENASYYNLDIE